MLKPLLTLALIATTTAAFAQNRPSTTRMSCAATQRLVASRGAIVLSTGPSTYDRFVINERFCTPSETIRPAWARTKDSPRCMIGYTCEEFHPGEFRW